LNRAKRLSVVGVSKSFGRIKALDKVSFDVERGEYVCIIGPSGCGKTTLLKIIAGILAPDEGIILFNGKVVNNLPPEERRVGYIFQDILLFPHMNLWENIVYSPRVRGLSSREIRALAKEILDSLKLSVRLNSHPSELSRGVQQKTAIARALATEADLLLLDEPLSSLDYRVRIELRFELRRMVKELNLTAVHVTHDQEEAMSIADRIIVMRKGRIEQIGTPLELYLNPKNPFVAKFIGGECNFLEGRIEEIRGNIAVIKTKCGIRLSSRISGFKLGDKVLVAVKPEHFNLLVKEASDKLNVIDGLIKSVRYLGVYVRAEVSIGDISLIVKAPKTYLNKFVENKKIKLKIPDQAVNVFPYPHEGIKRAIAIE